MGRALQGCVVLVGFLVLSQSSAAEPDVRLYTNADLDRLGPAPAEPSRPIAQAELGWDDVQGFIDREHARINEDRAGDRERAATTEVPSDVLYGRRVFAGRFLSAPFWCGHGFRTAHRDVSHGGQRGFRKDPGGNARRLDGIRPRSSRRS